MAPSGMLRRVALVRTDVSEELNACFIRMTRIGELETTLAATSNRRKLRNISLVAPGIEPRTSGLAE
jgi:DNA-binding TFAR19-related protein (PDSD5 family)